MKNYDQSPKDKDSYTKSIKIIKSKLIDNLYKKFIIEINMFFALEFVQKMIPFLKNILGIEPTNIILTDILSIANILITKKEIEEPQIELLKQYLLEKVEELNLK